ncbi:Transcription initiation factor IIE subunit beta [Taphrina deformans PYCC 5710]|uniref:Transcription initiation factor IIE subunit beta n=1 Tax=Taphrina deformans (strain PYCC 5710 / ATCC 11124 / CBS 356.35 / IMI 108563 / JCM 9778 / NBRC 8474) TaxID=1097556 RepID=R4X7A7_TAPDE|nr:Transcription initiation factor IIE subunit beta [Taphrina deformans PYCC 5710]|eukprot:CCG81191.1 Transcription initiation factor IIE subunit beta [Taphrina deformans PYCC 5710]
MSELNASAAAFKKQAKTAEVIPRFRVQQQPKPDPIDLSDEEPAKKKTKIEIVRPIYSQPDALSSGQEVITNMHYAMQYLKRDGNSAGKTSAELEGYLSLGGPLPASLIHILRKNERIHYDSQTDTYSFRPVYNVRSAPQLLALLEAQKTCSGLSVKDLREGWPNCIEELDRLEKEGKILLIRQKKDDRPRTVWKSNIEYAPHIDQEFVDIFRKVVVPGRDQLPRELQSLGLKPTSVDPATAIYRQAKGDTKQKKPNKKLSKVTNTHMSGLKDLGMRR